MANPTPVQIRKVPDTDLTDAQALLKREVMLTLNCHALATIQSFDSVKQTVTATINYKRTYLQRQTDGTYAQIQADYPLLLDVPAIVLSGGMACMTFPIAKGDTCLLLFNDRDIDNWFQSGQIAPVATSRLHSLSDAVALIGVRPATNPISDYDMNHAGIRWGDSKIQVSEDKLLLENAVETLNDILQDLLTQIQTLTVICAAPSNPSSVPVNAAAFAAIATRLGGLLE